ncbi:Glycerate kinase [uncultured Ruminococcus sp.]|uniref:Glycerate kinase n=1 Tax=Massiliimalia timonensis TaxID=1987501 RepID=A0A8J6TUE2_9FIRM|nr:glycerate kinase [Massiliimalia timonensis]MBC8610513.1 glycerate kinase [Massiliimalia timonensis]SCH87924.1 Glycerate kinase [uncultured Clostridium sp.]SCI20557.1 Glycerate kinase [uncultured Ruminococcus sp.]
MQRFIIIPDSFKGTISSIEICEIIRQKAQLIFPDCDVVTLPVADGGEGTVDCFLQAMPGEKVSCQVTGPWFEQVDSFYGMFGKTAVIEMAAAAGLPMVEDRKDPSKTTTYGVGELMKHAMEHGATEIVLGMGGSCTTDGGCGCAAALGAKFYREDGSEFVPVGENLDQIARVDLQEVEKLCKGVSITAMCDVENPMYGSRGAAYVFGPQKGAGPRMVEMLDQNLKALAKIMEEQLGLAGLPQQEGAGAAGAFGAGAVAFLGAKLNSGIETVLDHVHFDEHLKTADAVFTGEGRFDSQSLDGKVISGVARRTKAAEVPLYVIAGDLARDIPDAYSRGVTAMFSINRNAIPFEEAKKHSKEDLAFMAENIFRLMRGGK